MKADEELVAPVDHEWSCHELELEVNVVAGPDDVVPQDEELWLWLLCVDVLGLELEAGCDQEELDAFPLDVDDPVAGCDDDEDRESVFVVAGILLECDVVGTDDGIEDVQPWLLRDCEDIVAWLLLCDPEDFDCEDVDIDTLLLVVSGITIGVVEDFPGEDDIEDLLVDEAGID